MAWNPLKDPIDYFMISGQKSPGVASIAGAHDPSKWEEVGGYGITGSTLKYLGNGLATFDAKIVLATEEDWDDYHAWKPAIAKYPDVRHPKAKDIWHPFLEDLEISSVVVTSRSQPEPDGDDGLYVVTVNFIQYRIRKFTMVKKIEGAEASPTDPVDKQIEELRRQVDALRGKGAPAFPYET